MTNSVSINNSNRESSIRHPTPEIPPNRRCRQSDLSPDALMAYCQSRLDSIDGQVTASFTEQQTNASAISQIDQVISDAQDVRRRRPEGPAVCKKLEATFGALINSLKSLRPGLPCAPALTTTYNSMVWSGDGGAAVHPLAPGRSGLHRRDATTRPTESGPKGDNVLSSSELQGYVQTLSDAAGNLNSNSELQMVQLQSLMSQRQTAISLTTNLVQSLGDQENKIADNIGH